MQNMIFVKPSATARVRQPERNSAVMREEGDWIVRNVHYEALIASGDVIVVDPQPKYPTVSAEETATEKPVPETLTPPVPYTDQRPRRAAEGHFSQTPKIK